MHISSQEEHLVPPQKKKELLVRWSWLQSCLQGVRAQIWILAAAFFFNFSLFHDQLNQPIVRPVFSIEPRFVRFSHNSLIHGSLGLKNRISVWFLVFPVGLPGPVRVSKPCATLQTTITLNCLEGWLSYSDSNNKYFNFCLLSKFVNFMSLELDFSI